MFDINVSYVPFYLKWFLTEDHIEGNKMAIRKKKRSSDFLRVSHRKKP